ncbi:hypothetical protein L6452_22728 [Arctium lappa]|uniref:Uncharacterized protein n=1 Tax=Arctium lappa TaxID=4217 RepID=A0ACB9B183_ARCLA|nr:hypothetical protein L6452_22728 [Arctium lappa]
MPEVPKLSPLGLSFRKPVRSEGSTETEPSSLADLSLAFIPSLSGVPKGMAGRIEGIRMRCPRSGVGGRDIIHLIAWEKALRSFDLEAWAGAS